MKRCPGLEHGGVVYEGDCGSPERFLVDGSRGQAIDTAVEREGDSAIQIVKRGLAAFRRDLSGGDTILQGSDIHQVETAVFVAALGGICDHVDRRRPRGGFQGARQDGPVREDDRPDGAVHVGVRECLDHDFRADAGRVADSDGDERAVVRCGHQACLNETVSPGHRDDRGVGVRR